MPASVRESARGSAVPSSGDFMSRSVASHSNPRVESRAVTYVSSRCVRPPFIGGIAINDVLSLGTMYISNSSDAANFTDHARTGAQLALKWLQDEKRAITKLNPAAYGLPRTQASRAEQLQQGGEMLAAMSAQPSTYGNIGNRLAGQGCSYRLRKPTPLPPRVTPRQETTNHSGPTLPLKRQAPIRSSSRWRSRITTGHGARTKFRWGKTCNISVLRKRTQKREVTRTAASTGSVKFCPPSPSPQVPSAALFLVSLWFLSIDV